ncbi:MAG: hypothetical protein DRO14_04680 [Thermoprotei archaeon]|nr:MAG: hypothetical protein DRO14_04680 [Thermoprotei archaeon]
MSREDREEAITLLLLLAGMGTKIGKAVGTVAATVKAITSKPGMGMIGAALMALESYCAVNPESEACKQYYNYVGETYEASTGQKIVEGTIATVIALEAIRRHLLYRIGVREAIKWAFKTMARTILPLEIADMAIDLGCKYLPESAPEKLKEFCNLYNRVWEEIYEAYKNLKDYAEKLRGHEVLWWGT